MRARLIALKGTERGDSFKLGRAAEFSIGRGDECDLIIDRVEVSRVHAVVHLDVEAGRHFLSDARSANGTFLNGRAVGSTPVPLAPGDRVELTPGIAFLYEEDPTSAFSLVPAVALVLLALALAVAGFAWWQTGGDPILEEATAIAAGGLEAARAGSPEEAKAQFQEAAGLLFRDGRLDDVGRGDVMRAAMERLGSRLPGDPDLWATFQSVVEAVSAKLVESGEPEPQCRLAEVSSRKLPACLREHVDLVLRRLHQSSSDAPVDFADEVGRRMRIEHRTLQIGLRRSDKVVPMLKVELEKANLPPILHYVAMIESVYDVSAESSAGAMGLWQLMPDTARRYRLKVGDSVDERLDPVRSTRAAARYLRDLTFEFGGDAMLLALAGYNRGENGVRRALKSLEDPFRDRSYWRLVERRLLPEETRKYVTRFVASAVAGEAGLPSLERLKEAGY